jgi:hypothetical protein
MKRLLWLLVFCPFLSEAQRTDWEIAYTKSIPAGVGEPIHLPKRDYNPHFVLPEGIQHKVKARIITIKDDSVYKKLFWRYIYTKDSLAAYKRQGANKYDIYWVEQHLVDSLPIIDFSKHDLILHTACAQCLAYCKHDEGEDNCHRNACNFRESWFLRSKIEPGVFSEKSYPCSASYRLPVLSRPVLTKFFEIGGYSSYSYVINSDSLYQKIFSAYDKDPLPVIDFSKDELVLNVSCSQCMVTCRNIGRANRPCHRNACSYSSSWCVVAAGSTKKKYIFLNTQ